MTIKFITSKNIFMVGTMTKLGIQFKETRLKEKLIVKLFNRLILST